MEDTRKIRRLVTGLLERFQVDKPPIPVEAIVEGLGIEVRYRQPEDRQWSGMLFRVGKSGIIAVNEGHPRTRRRFTLAHELGHFFLSDQSSAVFVDTAIVKFRNDTSSLGVDAEEILANRFAAELLMPLHFLMEDIDPSSDLEWAIPELAQRYDVSEQAMMFRLVNLGLVSPH